MRITARLIVALAIAATLVAAGSTFFQARQEKRGLLDDLNRRGEILSQTFGDLVQSALESGSRRRLEDVVKKYGSHGRLNGIAVFNAEDKPLAFTPALSGEIAALEQTVKRALAQQSPADAVLGSPDGDFHAYVTPLAPNRGLVGALAVVHDASYIKVRIDELWKNNFLRLLIEVFIISLVTLWIVRWNIMSPLDDLTDWMRKTRAGEPAAAPPLPKGLQPLAAEASFLAESLAEARAVAEEEAHLRHKAASLWTAERLKEHVKATLEGRPIFVVANREPYMHVRKGGKVEVLTPASGLVTGIEPILLACGGVWVAHGAGDADQESADAHGRIAVPPESPQYTLRRVWLTKEEEEGYYYGFANEGLWPLCHIAYTRPQFKASDWNYYQVANQKFADALIEEMAGVREPCVLIQDYHFALLPKLIKKKRPDARVALFWHIPWPNPEAFAVCPWQREILEGMIAADIVGFHIQFHCNNFLETVDRTMECRIDWERFAVRRGGHSAGVRPYPISVAFPNPVAAKPNPGAAELLRREGLKAEFMGIGIDRIDYTKGLLERFSGIERFLEKYPQYRGRFTFVQIAAPSRTRIKRYRDLQEELESEAKRINAKFAAKDYAAIVLMASHHNHADIEPYYKAANLCMVTSLHDGMNLVAKEFIASRDEENGVLILSRFTGASRELRDALIVNPYDFEQTADAIARAIEMSPEEQTARMVAMRAMVREHNVYAWAARLIDGLAQIRLSPSQEFKA
ncbi:MAG: trehalose-6-phosphate synthase [Elusimicrobia bacterium]|nr:trehalose-6-phosphate synthase [Elusimicrobiota bacterium]MDE2313017.1 trehalose-6-phosphate synthase [Elusimicrobiota bacterium]